VGEVIVHYSDKHGLARPTEFISAGEVIVHYNQKNGLARPTEFISVGEVIVHYSDKHGLARPTEFISVGEVIVHYNQKNGLARPRRPCVGGAHEWGANVVLVLESSAPPTRGRRGPRVLRRLTLSA
jgi:hypothetical protein